MSSMSSPNKFSPPAEFAGSTVGRGIDWLLADILDLKRWGTLAEHCRSGGHD